MTTPIIFKSVCPRLPKHRLLYTVIVWTVLAGVCEGRSSLSLESALSKDNLGDQMTLVSRGPIPLYYESLYGI